jgi:hypothetical protein
VNLASLATHGELGRGTPDQRTRLSTLCATPLLADLPIPKGMPIAISWPAAAIATAMAPKTTDRAGVRKA